MTVSTARIDRICPLQRKEPMILYTTSTTNEDHKRKSRCISNFLIENKTNVDEVEVVVRRTIQKSKSARNVRSNIDMIPLHIHRKEIPVSSFDFETDDQFVLEMPQFEKYTSIHDLLHESNVSCLTESWVGDDHDDDDDLSCYGYEFNPGGVDNPPVAPRRESTRSFIGCDWQEEFGVVDVPPKSPPPPPPRCTRKSFRTSPKKSRIDNIQSPHLRKNRLSTKQSRQSFTYDIVDSHTDHSSQAYPPRFPRRRSTRSSKATAVPGNTDTDTYTDDDDEVITKEFNERYCVAVQGPRYPINRRGSV